MSKKKLKVAKVEYLPLFVYGSLRQGQKLHSVFRGIVDRIENGEADDMLLFCSRNAAFPYMTSAVEIPVYLEATKYTTREVKGDLIYVQRSAFDKIVATLDEIEGVEWGHYKREKIHVFAFDNGYVEAWAYLATPQVIDHLLGHNPIIESGDWLEKNTTHRETSPRSRVG